ncbi:MAG: SRPBCC domain-containing protein [Aestuariivirga sp.]
MMPATSHAQFNITRNYPAPIEAAWALWTTKDGIESWWGPEGFEVVVSALDLRPGGELIYLMTARAPQQVAFMKQAGMPLSTPCKVTYTDVQPTVRLAYKTLTDFVPNVKSYEVGTVVELQRTTVGTKVTITFDAMHDDIWTERARAGHESQMRKLDALISSKTGEVNA